MISLTQFDGGKLHLSEKPERIVSLVPSITENLILFGKTPAARTSFCIEPKEVVKSIPVIGGTKTPRVSKIISMKPDLVIANQEENIKEHVEEIQQAGIPVWVNFPNTVRDLLPLMKELVMLCENDVQAKPWIEQTENLLSRQPSVKRSPKVITLIWKDPWMAVGQDTYTSDLLKFCGMQNPVR
jgi:ABC-type Fe3+-hydroxamate transport system substrate-binding protein